MRKIKTVKIDDREITIKELRVKDLISILEGDESRDVMGRVSELLPLCSSLSVDDLREMAPSEIAQIYEAFREVNAVFFDAARQMGLSEVISALKETIRTEFSEALAGSLRQVTQTPLATGIPTS